MPNYTDPKLRERLKARIMKGDKGGRPGQWSARKAQLLAQAYKKEGGGYKTSKKSPQKSLEQWGDQKWTTADGKPARRRGGTTRYLPKKAWDALTPKEKEATQKAKRAGSQKGEQFVANTPAAKRARKKITKATKKKTKSPSRKKTTTKKKARKTKARKTKTRKTPTRKAAKKR